MCRIMEHSYEKNTLILGLTLLMQSRLVAAILDFCYNMSNIKAPPSEFRRNKW